MAPKGEKMNPSCRKDAPQSQQQEDSVDPGPVDDGTLTPAVTSDNASNQSHGPEMKQSPGIYIKQEPTSGMASAPSTPASRIASTSDPIPSALEGLGGNHEGSSCLGKPHDPSLMSLQNNSITTAMTGAAMAISKSNHGSDTDFNDSYTAANPINEISHISKMNDEELSAYLNHFRNEESRLPSKKDQGILTGLYSRRAKQIRRSIQELKDELNRRQSDITSAMAASKNLVRSQLSVMNESEAQQGEESGKRCLRKRKSGKQPEPDSRRVKRPKISKESHQIKDTIMKGSFSRIKGETSAAFDKDAKDLPEIDEAPVHLRDQLHAIKNTATQNPGVDKGMIDHDLGVFAGILRVVFGDLIQPWVSPGDGPKKVGDYKWRLIGMNEPLHNHQLPAIGVMIMSEKDNTNDGVAKFALKSGFLFDYMGLGKTVEIFGCIVVNMPHLRMNQRSKRGRTTTLIVVPKSAVLQWHSEAHRHCPDLKVSLYTKECEQQPVKALSHDVLLVTYDQLLSAARLKTKKQSSFLFKSEFFRVCLDEAHKIKNRVSETFKLCCKLQAKHRWCASGTPTPNGIAELYSYLKFIKHPLVDEFPAFKDKYLGGKRGKPATKGAEKKYEELDQILEPIMIMRTPGHQLLGGPLFDLPTIHHYAPSFSLSPEEAVIYEYLEKHIAEYIVKKSGKNPKPKTQPIRPRKKSQGEASVSDDEGLGFMSLCEVALRFRQLVASPLLLEHIVRDGIWTSEQVIEMKDKAHSQDCARTPFIDRFEAWISQPSIPQTASKKAKRQEKQRNKLNSLCCPACNKRQQQNPHKSQCSCVWCQECVEYRINFCKDTKRAALCMRCNMPIGTPIPCVLPIHPSSDSGVLDIEHPRMRGQDFLRFQPEDDCESTLFRDLDTNAGTEIPLSSKMRAILEQIRAWQTSAPEDKIILFFQFIWTQKLLGRVFQDQGIEFLYFIGEMDYKQREAAKKCFQSDPNIKVMMMSMQCGGEALNLTAANRVVITDPWFNRSVEEQAICRVARIGQSKEVHAVRLLARDTIDTRMYDMQEFKEKQVSNAFQYFQGDKSFGPRALRRVLGYRFQREGDDDDQDAIEDEEDYDDSIDDVDPDYEDEDG